MMLSVLEDIPDGLLDLAATDLHRALSGPTLIHLPGRRREPLFVSVLLHGNEHTGWDAVRKLLRRHEGRELPRAMSLFIGNVAAARENERFLPGQPDFNRVWTPGAGGAETPVHAMAGQVLAEARRRGVFASVDIHNNTGVNPHYACVRRLDHRFFHLATLFSRIVVYFRKPEGVQTQAFSSLCPSVTVECGQSGESHGVDHALDFLDGCLRLSAIPDHPVSPHDIDLFHTVAVVKVPRELSLGLGATPADLRLPEDLDHLNFCELPPMTLVARVDPGVARRGTPVLDVRDERGREAFDRYFAVHQEEEVVTAVPLMFAMLSIRLEAIRQDCLCYIMERSHAGYRAAGASSAGS